MPPNDEAPPLSTSQLFDELKEQGEESRQQLDRVAGMAAETVTQITRVARLVAAGQSLDGRQKRDFDERMDRLDHAMRSFALLSFDRWTPDDIARRFDRPRIDAARRILKAAEESGSPLMRLKDDSITLRVSLPGKKDRKKLAATIAKALAAAAAGAILRHVLG